jgi:hypothetical protein
MRWSATRANSSTSPTPRGQNTSRANLRPRVHEGSYSGISPALTDPVRLREVRHDLDDYLQRFEGDEREGRDGVGAA